jgi:hypothetical protein
VKGWSWHTTVFGEWDGTATLLQDNRGVWQMCDGDFHEPL